MVKCFDFCFKQVPAKLRLHVKAKEEIHELQAKGFIISTKKSLGVKDNTQYVPNKYQSYSLPISDLGSYSLEPISDIFVLNEQTPKTFPIYAGKKQTNSYLI